jgi:2-methylcitrate dehydratase PrpD
VQRRGGVVAVTHPRGDRTRRSSPFRCAAKRFGQGRTSAGGCARADLVDDGIVPRARAGVEGELGIEGLLLAGEPEAENASSILLARSRD